MNRPIFNIGTSEGSIVAFKDTGIVAHIFIESRDAYINNIKCFDINEYLAFWNVSELPDNIDILNLGYWYVVRCPKTEHKSGFKEVYEPPAMDWRVELPYFNKSKAA